jgi:hypothetical protein
MDLKAVVRENLDWIHLTQDRVQWRALVKAVMNLCVPLKLRKFMTRFTALTISRMTLLHGVRLVLMNFV